MTYTDGQYGPVEILDAAGNAFDGSSPARSYTVAVPTGYTATKDAHGNLTVRGPASDAVACVLTPGVGAPFTLTVAVSPRPSDLNTTAALAGAAVRTVNGHTGNSITLTHTDVGAMAAGDIPTLTRDAIEEVLYDKAYSWELVPGSDVMATCIGVLPKIGPASDPSLTVYAGLVTTSEGAATPSGQWYLADVDLPLDGVILDSECSHDPRPAGVYLAVFYASSNGFAGWSNNPPYAFPEGWTPGNTTGSGPVLPFIGTSSSGDDIYAGLVDVAPGSIESTTNAFLLPADTSLALGASGLEGSPAIHNGGSPGGVFLGVFDPSAGDVDPTTTLPEGWTFRPYGIGPVAATDENAGGVIGDVAYVVSGWVTNRSVASALLAGFASPVSFGLAAAFIPAGSVFTATTDNIHVSGGQGFIESDHTYVAKVDVEVVASSPPGDFWLVSAADHNVVVDVSTDVQVRVLPEVYYWPFIERFDLAQKKWLPRIPLPAIDPVFFPWGSAVGYDIGYTTSYEGVNYVSLTQNAGAVPPDSPGDWQVQPPLPPAVWASEGGIAGVIDGKLYFGGGDGDNITGQEFFVYDPADDSITRLNDNTTTSPGFIDYSAYGVIGNRLVVLVNDLDFDAAVHYLDAAGHWTSEKITNHSTGPNDQVQGFEIDGKLWFVYIGAAFVFDPVTLTVTAKATTSSLVSGSPFLVDGKFQVFETVRDQNNGERLPQFRAATYNPVIDTWSVRHDVVDRDPSLPGIPADYAAEFVGITWQGVPYMLSGIESPIRGGVTGVYGLTGVVLDRPQAQRLDEIADASSLAASVAAERVRQSRSEPLYLAVSGTGGSILALIAVPVTDPSTGRLGLTHQQIFFKADSYINMGCGDGYFSGPISVSFSDPEHVGTGVNENRSLVAGVSISPSVYVPIDSHVVVHVDAGDAYRTPH